MIDVLIAFGLGFVSGIFFGALILALAVIAKERDT